MQSQDHFLQNDGKALSSSLALHGWVWLLISCFSSAVSSSWNLALCLSMHVLVVASSTLVASGVTSFDIVQPLKVVWMQNNLGVNLGSLWSIIVVNEYPWRMFQPFTLNLWYSDVHDTGIRKRELIIIPGSLFQSGKCGREPMLRLSRLRTQNPLCVGTVRRSCIWCQAGCHLHWAFVMWGHVDLCRNSTRLGVCRFLGY